MTRNSIQQSTPSATESFSVTYSAKDAILFALAVGFGSSEEHYDRDLRYLHEEHERFEVVPLWGLALPFWAHCHGEKPLLPLFPPPLMSSMGLIPRTNLRGDDSIQLQEYPVLHMFQSIEWHTFFPTASKETVSTLQLFPSFKSIQPKSIGTFVTTESIVAHQKTPICSIQSTVLILGLPPEHVIPHSTSDNNRSSKPKARNRSEWGEVWLEKSQKVDVNVALLYRIASGDTNHIHVLPVVSEKPLLHGLCTLAIAATSIMQKVPDSTPTILQGSFTKPVFLNETISIKVWRREESLEFDFIVYNQTKDEVCDRELASIAALRLRIVRSSATDLNATVSEINIDALSASVEQLEQSKS